MKKFKIDSKEFRNYINKLITENLGMNETVVSDTEVKLNNIIGQLGTEGTLNAIVKFIDKNALEQILTYIEEHNTEDYTTKMPYDSNDYSQHVQADTSLSEQKKK